MKHIRIIGTILLVTLLVALIATTAMAAPKGKLQIKGSDTLLPLAQAWAEAFMIKYPGTMIAVTGGGSGVGIASLLNNTCDIADASREAKPKEDMAAKNMNTNLVETKVAKDGLSIVVHPSNTVENLTLAQVKAIYTGKVTNWNQVGGADQRIVPAGRDTSSGTYVFFQDFVLGGQKYTADMQSHVSNNAICNSVSQSEGGIGYVGLAYADTYGAKGKVKILRVSKKTGQTGYSANPESVKNGTYPIWRYLYNYTRGKPRGLAADYLKFVASDEGQAIVEKVGYVGLK